VPIASARLTITFAEQYPMNQPRTPGSEAADEALHSTHRHEASDDFPPNDTLGPTPDGAEDRNPRDLAPRPVERQFGSKPDLEPEGDPDDGDEQWLDERRERKDSFPDRGNPGP
jgi:hypothetical protein